MENNNLIENPGIVDPDGTHKNPDPEVKISSDNNESAGGVLKVFRVLLYLFSILILGLVIFLFIFYGVPALSEIPKHHSGIVRGSDEIRNDPQYKKQVAALTKDIQKLSTKYNSYTSGQSYFVVNTTDNKFSLYTNKNLIREGFCSTGSYVQLHAATGNKKWVFKTPRGKYWIHDKKTNPVWKRPHWSFVEEGAKIPSANDESRFEYGVLGDYALTLGDGYMIHGTIYKRFIGMPVTHGCVRLNDDDLKAVYSTLNIGSKVYIF